MEISTKYFGAMKYEQDSILHFPDGLFGFDEEKEFLLIPFEGGDESLLCLQSVTTPSLAFVAVNPFMIYPEYAPKISQKDIEELEGNSSEDFCYYNFCVVKEPIGKSTLNLKCPLVINDTTRKARQVILDQYEMRHLLSDFGKAVESC
ncbi:MAG: flagellar assembly protein FliW [Eubacteriales bacterium]